MADVSSKIDRARNKPSIPKECILIDVYSAHAKHTTESVLVNDVKGILSLDGAKLEKLYNEALTKGMDTTVTFHKLVILREALTPGQIEEQLGATHYDFVRFLEAFLKSSFKEVHYSHQLLFLPILDKILGIRYAEEKLTGKDLYVKTNSRNTLFDYHSLVSSLDVVKDHFEETDLNDDLIAFLQEVFSF